MTSPAKFLSDTSVAEGDYDDFECSDRSTPVDLQALKNLGNQILGGETIATGYAVKLCLHGLKIKPDDYMKVKGVTYSFKDMLEILKKQPGYNKDVTSQGKSASKTIVTPLRIARIYAANVSLLISKKKVEVPADLLSIANEVGLKPEYAFLTALYGMDDDAVVENGKKFLLFCAKFDKIIAEAHKKGWATGTSKRSHAEAAKSYMEWRGFSGL